MKPMQVKTDKELRTGSKPNLALNPAWVAFIRHCQELGFGEISHLKIQDGIPVMAEEISRKIKFS